MRGQFEILDTDDSEAAWSKLSRGIEELISDDDHVSRARNVDGLVNHQIVTGRHFDGERRAREAAAFVVWPDLGTDRAQPAQEVAQVRGSDGAQRIDQRLRRRLL